MYYADLHIHSKYSRATSKDCDLEHLALWGRKKGITVIGTGDFTHPAWRAELEEKLLPAEPGLFRLKNELEREVTQQLDPSCQGETRFMLSVEISTIYKKGDRTRKVHHLIYAPDFETVDKLRSKLGAIGNLNADGRPILGLDSRHLLEMVLESGPGAYLVPAHIWTPWFAALGSKSGFDAIEECYADLAQHVFAVETGLSSDPPMNWRVSSLDRFRLVSNSDAHSPAKLGREACVFDTDVDYYGIRRALETGEGYGGTREFFPEEGKYHLDGHRKCDVVLEPEETRRLSGKCPVCRNPLTVGVLNRVEELADKPHDSSSPTASEFRNLVALPEILSELHGVGVASKRVEQAYHGLLSRLGPELFILENAPLEDVRKYGSTLLGEAVERMRSGHVIRQAGYDGEYGVIRLFTPSELHERVTVGLFDPQGSPIKPKSKSSDKRRVTPIERSLFQNENDAQVNFVTQSTEPPLPAVESHRLLEKLDADQRTAAEHLAGPLRIVAGPGTGKTRTLTYRIANAVTKNTCAPESCLAVTFTHRAANEMKERLEQLLPIDAGGINVVTLHALGLQILRQHRTQAGLHRGFRVASEPERTALLCGLDASENAAKRLMRRMSQAKRMGAIPSFSNEDQRMLNAYETQMEARSWIDFDDLIRLPVELLRAHQDIRDAYRDRYRLVSVDEFQDIDALQYELLKLLVAPNGNLCVIGDPDQSIYSFRGADVNLFSAFCEDFPNCTTVRLTHNYRSGKSILGASQQVISRSEFDIERGLHATFELDQKITIHEAATDKAEAEFVVHTIEQLLGGTAHFSIDSGRVTDRDVSTLSFADVAILFRTDAQADTLEAALLRSGMPYQRRSTKRWLERSDLLGLLRTATDVPGGTAIDRIRKAGASLGPDCLALLEKLRSLPGALGHDLEAFVEQATLASDVDSWDPRAQSISLMTLHASKGLEFCVVFMVGCEDGILPLRFGPECNLEEERRLFYVGMTRAKERLFLCRARKRTKHGQVQPSEPSPFLQDIEKELLEFATSQARVTPRRQQLSWSFDL